MPDINTESPRLNSSPKKEASSMNMNVGVVFERARTTVAMLELAKRVFVAVYVVLAAIFLFSTGGAIGLVGAAFILASAGLQYISMSWLINVLELLGVIADR